MRGLLLGLFIAALSTPALSQPAKLAVYLEASAGDPVGNRLTFYLRDELGRSGFFAPAASADDANVKVTLVTMDPYASSSTDAGVNTIYSYTILIANPDGLDYYVTSYVGACSTAPKSCAASLVGYLGEHIEDLRQRLNRNTSLR